MKREINYLDDIGTFSLEYPEDDHYLYFPIAGEKGLKSAVTPVLGGDAKISQEAFLFEPVSSENLHNNKSTRNIWIRMEDGPVWSAAGASAEAEVLRYTDDRDESRMKAGLMWHTLYRKSQKLGIEAEISSFVPVHDNTEIHIAELKNRSGHPVTFTCTAALPLYGRSADNIRDHRNVTSMLHRIRVSKNAVLVKPTMSFDERGHRLNHLTYFAAGTDGDGNAPDCFYPTVDLFTGRGGSFAAPESIYLGRDGVPAGFEADGTEAVGAFRFPAVTLENEETVVYILQAGILTEEEDAAEQIKKYDTFKKAAECLYSVKKYWQEKVNVCYHTGDPSFDSWLRWVSFQPHLRRLYGCSFLPHHDYGRGGRGWRDLWQDCLSLLIMDPGDVRQMIIDNFGGVRIDGTNATIIGHRQGEFIADRNGIARVWMDHALWPLMTTRFYIDQTGDAAVLLQKVPYFKDAQAMRGNDIDEKWNAEEGTLLHTSNGETYEGTILEHLLTEHLTSFFEVGEHNLYRLRGADWNDALDMAAENGESVAFSSAYAGNLRTLVYLLDLLREKEGLETVELHKELAVLSRDDRALYDDVEGKNRLLDEYASMCRHTVSGETVQVSIDVLRENLLHKSDWLMEHIRGQEWLEGDDTEGWFNSYYDNHKRQVEGKTPDGVRMMLTGQVFAIMSGTATDEQVREICRAADHYLYVPEKGGYRINTDFKELKMDMGRMFGFAYGEKENGAVFSHMTVMYANALYQRGFAREGYKALQTLADTAMDFDTSRIYPGIPEYFNAEGKGLYHYLTGAASWYMMTMVTQVFGVHGRAGDLVIRPALMLEQFDKNAEAYISFVFADKEFCLHIYNPHGREFGNYRIQSAKCLDHEPEISEDGSEAVFARNTIENLTEKEYSIEMIIA